MYLLYLIIFLYQATSVPIAIQPKAQVLPGGNTFKSKNVMADLKSNPEQFIAKVGNYDPVELRYAISVLQGLRASSKVHKNNILNWKDTQLQSLDAELTKLLAMEKDIIEGEDAGNDFLVQELEAEQSSLTYAINTLEVVHQQKTNGTLFEYLEYKNSCFDLGNHGHGHGHSLGGFGGVGGVGQGNGYENGFGGFDDVGDVGGVGGDDHSSCWYADERSDCEALCDVDVNCKMYEYSNAHAEHVDPNIVLQSCCIAPTCDLDQYGLPTCLNHYDGPGHPAGLACLQRTTYVKAGSPTPPPTPYSTPSDCTNLEQWVDSYGTGCSYYDTNGCDGAEQWPNPDTEINAYEACCVCGKSPSDPNAATSPPTSQVSSPIHFETFGPTTSPPTSHVSSSPTPFEIFSPTTSPPTFPSTETLSNCVDLEGWVDSYKDGCYYYEDNGCDGAEEWPNKDTGINAYEACCVCRDKSPSDPNLSFAEAKHHQFQHHRHHRHHQHGRSKL